MMDKEQQGNSNAEEVFDSGDFFSELEHSVNGMQTDGGEARQEEVTRQDVGPEKVERLYV